MYFQCVILNAAVVLLWCVVVAEGSWGVRWLGRPPAGCAVLLRGRPHTAPLQPAGDWSSWDTSCLAPAPASSFRATTCISMLSSMSTRWGWWAGEGGPGPAREWCGSPFSRGWLARRAGLGRGWPSPALTRILAAARVCGGARTARASVPWCYIGWVRTQHWGDKLIRGNHCPAPAAIAAHIQYTVQLR